MNDTGLSVENNQLSSVNEQIYNVQLSDIFEGPMDLLIYLIKKNEVDIYDIPIALITDQYLKHLKWMKSMNIDFAGDFILMAATLAQIKSKMLLPVHEDEDEEDKEDPRLEIARPLLEYLKMKSAAEQLTERDLLGEDIFVRNQDKEPYLINKGDEIIKVGLFELVNAFQKILENESADCKVDFTLDTISVKEKISEIVNIFEEKKSITFGELFPSNAGKSEVILTFLAVLEMVKLYLVGIVQYTRTGIIRLFYL